MYWKNTLYHLCISALFFFTSLVQASCKIETPNAFLSQIKKQHPQLLLNQSSLQEVQVLTEVAKQRPNPQLQLNGAQGEEVDGDVERQNIALYHTIELGGKRDSRIGHAQSLVQKERFELKDRNEDIIIDAIIKAYRLKQVQDLLPIYKEAYSALKKILVIKQKRKALSPEEQVEKETLVLATNDYSLKISRLASEKVNLIRHLSFYLGNECELENGALPSEINLKKTFSKNLSLEGYSKVLSAKKGLELAQASLELEKSKAWPNMKIGPTLEIESVDGTEYRRVGIGVTIDLPLLSTNSGAKERSVRQIRSATLRMKNIENEAKQDLFWWISKYDTYRESLRSITSKKDLDAKHHRIEKLFQRGVISTAMVIESHRQLIDFANSRYEFELGAVEALWNIYKLDASLMQQTL